MEIGKINIDFQIIDSGDPKILMIADFSNWMSIENKPAVISIKMPGSTIPIQHNFIKKKLNGFNSNTLEIGCVVNCDDQDYLDLPDGIYDITLEGSPNTFKKQRYYLKLDNTKLELDKQLVKLGFEYDLSNQYYVEHLQTIDFLLTVASAQTRLGDIPKAAEHFNMALDLLERNKECKNCL